MGSLVRVATAWTTSADPVLGSGEAYAKLCAELQSEPDFLVAQLSTGYDIQAVMSHLSDLAGPCPIHGSTTCRGVMTAEGLHLDEGRALGLFGLADPDGSYGVAGCELGDRAREQSGELVHRALEEAGRPGEVPSLIWITPTPGSEEEVLAGIADVVGSSVQVMGATSADNNYEGRWRQIHRGQVFSNGLVLTVMFPSSGIACSFHNGYLPTGYRGVVTRCEDRDLWEIDGEPAAKVYARWTPDTMAEVIEQGGSILAASTYFPLGVEVQELRGFPDYLLSHPTYVHPDGRLTLSADVGVGETVVLMEGSRTSMIERAGRVAASVIDSGDLFSSGMSGALVTYCAGCRRAVAGDMDLVASNLRQTLGQVPFLGAFSFGEQGCFSGAGNQHGNLMISILAFGERSPG